jgi:signal transduction histidine kinase/DNA-binding response OmpR family regulator/ligand-binding sensor domain-containing protein
MKYHDKYKLLTTAVLLLMCGTALADNWQLYTSDRLLSTQINCICQDRYGYIWIGTEYGLDRFDGYQFVPFLHKSADTTSLSSNSVSSLFCDRDGSLWVGLSNGLAWYDYQSSQFHRMTADKGAMPRANSMAQTKDGTLLVGGTGNGLFRADKKQGKIYEVKNRTNCVQPLFFSRIYVDSRGFLWKASHISDFSMLTIRGNVLTGAMNFHSPCGPPASFIERDGRMYIVCTYGILEYDYATRKMKPADVDIHEMGNGVIIRRTIIDRNGNIYIGTRGKGVFVISKGSRQLKRFNIEEGSSFNLKTANINSLIKDKDNNLWMACFHKGLLLVDDRPEAFKQWNFSDQHYPIGSCVSSIAEGKDGSTWCIVEYNGLYRFDSKGTMVAHSRAPSDVRVIYRDRMHRYWLCSENALYSCEPESGSYTKKLAFEGWGVNCVTDDAYGNLYISNFGKGLVVYNTASGKARFYSMNIKRSRELGLQNDWIQSMAVDRSGMLWIGTSHGLECMDTKSGRFINLNGKSVGKSLQSLPCTAVAILPNDNVLICTDTSVYEYHKESKKTTTLHGSELLEGINIGAAVVDQHGDTWFSTSSGIWEYSYRQQKMISHVLGNGLKYREYISGAFLHYSDDRIGFGTDDGVTVFYPERVKDDKVQLGEAMLTSFYALDKSMDVTQNYFEVPYAENTFMLTFSLLNYKNADNVTFQYRLDEAKDWNMTIPGFNFISLNKLTPGKYELEVRAFSNGMPSDKIKKITIVVRQPWYNSIPARVIYIMLIMGTLIFSLYLYNRKKRGELDEEKMKFLINATHDIRSPLTLIMGPLHKLQQKQAEKGEKADTETEEELNIIDRNAKRLMQIVNQILDERKIDKKQMFLRCSNTEMVTFLEGIISLYKYNAAQRNITLTFEHDDKKLYAWIDRVQFDKVISNLLSNALKYTFSGGEITVTLERNDNSIAGSKGSAVIKVMDTGIGIKEEKPERLFDRFYQGRRTHDLHIEGSGIGLNLCKAIVALHHGTIKASNRDDGVHGTCLTVALPLGNSHFKPNELVEEKDTSADEKQLPSSYLRILIADDDEELGRYIAEELGAWYRFDCCPNGKEALKMLLTKDYHLLISDVMMPEMDGFSLLRSIKSNANISDIPVILLTSKSEVDNRLEGLKRGADAYLSKPFNMDELHILIDNLVGNVRRLKGKFSGAQGQKGRVEQKKVNGNNDELMKRIMASINRHMSDSDFNIDILASEAGISRAQLHRKMKEMTGISTAEFIRNIRLQQAARLLKEHKINVTQIAYDVGFSNSGHLATVFKKFYGVSPTEYAEGEGNEEK